MDADPLRDIDKLFSIWDTAVERYQTRPAEWSDTTAAYTAMSWGAYFEPLLEEDELLKDIHYNFGLLEYYGWDKDPENEKLWQKQMQLIAEAKRKYGRA